MVYSNIVASCDGHERDARSHHAFDLSNTPGPKDARQVLPHGEVLTDCVVLFSRYNILQELPRL